MEQLKMKTNDKINENIQSLIKLFPNIAVETKDENGQTKQAIDFDALKQELSSNVTNDLKQRYSLNWPGKKEAIIQANLPTNSTLRPILDESLDFENTQNLYIKGDNLEILKLLQNSYLNKIKMIYIDPPYNTGKDFIYKDNFTKDKNEELLLSGQIDENGDKLISNPQSNGRFHSDWLSMMYPRLKLSRNLLKDDGVIFISIDDNEVHNLRKICDEIFGEGNFVANFVWQSTAGSNTGSTIVTLTEYVLCYGKISKNIPFKLDMKNGKWKLKDNYFQKRGKYELQKLDGVFTSNHFSQSLVYPIKLPNGKNIYPGGGCSPSNALWNWRWSKKKTDWGLKNGFIEFIEREGKWTVYFKNYELVDNNNNLRQGSVPKKNIIGSDIATTSTGTIEINSMFGKQIFEFPKSSNLLIHLMKTLTFNPNDIILDFFSGSATTAHAVMELNAQEFDKLGGGGGRKFILVQIPELTDKKSEARKAGYENICEIGKERIKRAGIKIKQDYQDKKDIENLDVGFRVLELSSSNMKDVFYKPNEIIQKDINSLVENIKENRSSLDLLFGIMIDLGLSLDLKITKEIVCKREIFIVNDNELIVCFESHLNESFIKELAKKQAVKVVFRDGCFLDDSTLINAEQIFKQISPKTDIRVL